MKNQLEQFHYSNAGQFRAIASALGYKEQYNSNNQSISFVKGSEEHTYTIKELKRGSSLPDKDSTLEKSKENLLGFFDKDRARNSFDSYSRELREKNNIAIVRWDNIKEKNGQHQDGFTIIDLDKKIAYTGNEFYRYAYENNYTLDGGGGSLAVDWDSLEKTGVSTKNISQEERKNILEGKKSSIQKMSLKDNPENRQLLEKEKVDYKIEDGKLKFKAKISTEKKMYAEDTPINRSRLKKEKIDFKEETGGRLSIQGMSSIRKLALGALFLINPTVVLALLIIPKRKEIKNTQDFTLSRKEKEKLKKGDIVGRKVGNEKILMQVDRDTNELVKVNVKSIRIPNKIGGVELTPAQMEALKNGNKITITNPHTQQKASVSLDLNSTGGIKVESLNKRAVKARKEEDTPTNRKMKNNEKKEERREVNTPSTKKMESTKPKEKQEAVNPSVTKATSNKKTEGKKEATKKTTGYGKSKTTGYGKSGGTTNSLKR